MSTPERAPLRSVLTVCPFCACGCGLQLHGEGSVEGVGPSLGHPVSRGRLCARGWAAHEATIWGPRLRSPLIRRDGVLSPAGWPEALALAAESLRSLRDGGAALGVLGSGRCTNEENFLAAALARSALGTGNVDAGLRSAWDALVEGLGSRETNPDLTRTLERLDASDTIVVMEGDLAETHPRIALSVLRAVASGARLVTIGLKPTHLSELAVLHLAVQPWAPLAAIASLRASLAAEWGGSAGRHSPRADAGSPAASPASLARWLGESRLSAFVIGPFAHEPATLRGAAAAFQALGRDLVRMGRPEPLILPLPIRANTRGSFEMGVVPDLLPGQRPLDDEEARARLRRLWGGEPCWSPGRPAEELVLSVDGLVVVGDDVPAFHPNPPAARNALERLACLVVVDSFLTPTARAAHVVLPMAAFGETDGTVTNGGGRVQRLRAWTAPPPAVKPGWEILGSLLAALGSGREAESAQRVFHAVRLAIPAYSTINPAALELPGGVLSPAAVEGAAVSGEGAGDHGPGPRPTTGRSLLVRDGAFEWGDDPLVTGSPTLRRAGASRHRLNPRGVVAMGPEDASALGVRPGWKVRITSPQGQAETSVAVQPGLEAGVLLVPFGFREELGAVLGDAEMTEVQVARV